MRAIILHCHSLECGGHFSGQRTAAKVLQLGFYWPTLFKDAHSFVKTYDRCQRTGNISSKNEMPLNSIIEVELLMFRVLISWAHSLLLAEINTYYWQ